MQSCVVLQDRVYPFCMYQFTSERDRESLRHFSKNMSKYLIHFPKIEDTICFPVFFCHLTMYLGDIFKLKHSLFLFFCFLRNTNFAQKKILILLHLSIRLDIFAIPCILSIRVKGQHTLSHDQNRWLHLVSSLVSDIHTHTPSHLPEYSSDHLNLCSQLSQREIKISIR